MRRKRTARRESRADGVADTTRGLRAHLRIYASVSSFRSLRFLYSFIAHRDCHQRSVARALLKSPLPASPRGRRAAIERSRSFVLRGEAFVSPRTFPPVPRPAPPAARARARVAAAWMASMSSRAATHSRCASARKQSDAAAARETPLASSRVSESPESRESRVDLGKTVGGGRRSKARPAYAGRAFERSSASSRSIAAMDDSRFVRVCVFSVRFSSHARMTRVPARAAG